MIDFVNAKNIVIPEGEVSKIARGAEILWQKYSGPIYTELEYIQSTGTEWINTGIYPSDNTIKLEVKIAYNTTGTGQLMGSGTSGQERFNFGIESSRFRFGFGGSWFDANSEVLTADTEPHVWVLDANTKTGSIDGVAATTASTYSPGGSRAVVLFARGASANAESGNRTKGKIYYAKIWNKGELVREFIPVLDLDGVPCMYDKVSGEFFYNNGTGTFLYGEIHKHKYKMEIEYLEGTGTQWIDTGLKLCSEDVVYTKAYLENRNSIFGVTPSTAQRFNLTGSNNVSRFYFGSGSPYNASTPTSGPYEFECGAEYKIDGDIKYTLTTVFAECDLTSYMFARNNGVKADDIFKGKIYYLKVIRNGVTRGDFIPVLDWNDVPCMYDKVTEQLFYNGGTDAFAYA